MSTSYFCHCPKTGPGFYNVICHGLLFIMKMKWEIKVVTWDRLKNVAEFCVFIFNELTWEEIVRFVDIGGFIDHPSLNFFFHKMH
jgi:hypothetical protein